MQKTEKQVWRELEDEVEDLDIITPEMRMNLSDDVEMFCKGIITKEQLTRRMRGHVDNIKLAQGKSRTNGIKDIRKPTSQRTRVLAEIVAADANQLPEVTQFREEILGGTLLKPDEIQQWITQEHDKERGQPAHVLEVVLPPGSRTHMNQDGALVPDPPLVIGEQYPARGAHYELLAYATPDSDWERNVPIGHGSILARLHQLSTMLATRYTWHRAQATVFVLTGITRALSPIEATLTPVDRQTQAGRVTALSRIVLTIDPTLSPKEVCNYFQAIRQHVLGPKWRDLQEDNLQLIQFVLNRPPEESWPQCMEAWNKKVGNRQRLKKVGKFGEDLKCNNVSNFKRNCQNAITKLLEPVSLVGPRDKRQRRDMRADGHKAVATSTDRANG